jgi:putative transposase
MSSHLHLLSSRKDNYRLEEIYRDFKKFTSGNIITRIQEINESRKNWMLWIFRKAGERNKNNTNYQFWQQDNHPEELLTNKFFDQKLDYVHNNPVLAGLVGEPHHYKLSSAIDYAGGKGILEISFIE